MVMMYYIVMVNKEKNMKRLKYIKKLVVAISILTALVVTPVFATPSSSELKAEQEEAKKEASSLGNELNAIVTKINNLKIEIESTESDLEQAGVELEIAEELENEQYESMKLRIRYMYEESSNSVMLERILEAKNITDMLNQFEYVSDVHSYDREMLDKYIEAKEVVIEKHEAFEIKLEELEESKTEVTKQQSQLSTMLANKEAEISALDSKIAAAVQAEIEEAERKAAEAAAQAAAQAAAEAARQQAANSETSQGGTEDTATTQPESSNNSSNNTSTNNTSTNTSGKVTGSDIVNYALKFVGNKYVYGGTSLTNGIDCSGFTQAVYRAFGYSISRTSSAQRSNGVGVSYSAAQPGDIICYSGHVAIYMGNGMIVHASNSKAYPAGGIKTDSATYTNIIAVRRIL